MAVRALERTYDLQAIAFRMSTPTCATQVRVKPGERCRRLPVGMANVGSEPSPDVVAEISLPDFVTFADDNDACKYNARTDGREVWDAGVAAVGIQREAGHLLKRCRVKLAADAPGPVVLNGGVVRCRSAKMPR